MAGKPIRLPLAFVVYGLKIDFGYEYGVIAGGLIDSGEKRRLAKWETLARNFSIILSLYVLSRLMCRFIFLLCVSYVI